MSIIIFLHVHAAVQDGTCTPFVTLLIVQDSVVLIQGSTLVHYIGLWLKVISDSSIVSIETKAALQL